jgi:AP-4 complex subunit sigma-1
MFHLEKAHFIVDEMISNGYVVETNKTKILEPVQILEKM